MTLNPDLIRMRCAEIEESVQRLEPIARMEIDAFLVDQDLIDIACYRLLIAIEASLAVCYHVSARRLRKAPEDYAACFGGLGDAELLAPDLVKRLQQMARFRNLLVHSVLEDRLPAGTPDAGQQPHAPALVLGRHRLNAIREIDPELDMPLIAGTRLGQYEIQAPLGSGGMGEVYKAYDPTLQRTVAIKVLAKQDEHASVRLLQEARAASALDHPNICTVYEVGEATPSPQPSPREGSREGAVSFIVMAYVEGKPLSQRIPADGLPPETVIRYGAQIADALAHAHERGIVHRDLKSQNVVITPEGRAKVLDFGLAARMPQADAEAVTKTQEAIPHAGMLVGTLAYMAPEVLRGEAATARSDIWALGVLLYEMASGRLPFGGDTGADVASATLKDTPTTLPARVSAGLRSITHKCLAKEAGQRYALAAVVQGALDAIQSDTGVMQPAGLASTSGTRTRRMAAAAIGLVVIVGVTGYLSTGERRRVSLPGRAASRLGLRTGLRWSPDERYLVYADAGRNYQPGWACDWRWHAEHRWSLSVFRMGWPRGRHLGDGCG